MPSVTSLISSPPCITTQSQQTLNSPQFLSHNVLSCSFYQFSTPSVFFYSSAFAWYYPILVIAPTFYIPFYARQSWAWFNMVWIVSRRRETLDYLIGPSCLNGCDGARYARVVNTFVHVHMANFPPPQTPYPSSGHGSTLTNEIFPSNDIEMLDVVAAMSSEVWRSPSLNSLFSLFRPISGKSNTTPSPRRPVRTISNPLLLLKDPTLSLYSLRPVGLVWRSRRFWNHSRER